MSKRRNRRKQKGRGKIVLAGTALAGSVALFATVMVAALKEPVRDELGCYEELDGPTSTLIVDATVLSNDQQVRSIRRYLDRTWDTLKANERLNVYTSEGDRIGSVASPSFSVCGQASSPQEAKERGVPATSRSYLKREKRRIFEEILAPELGALITTSPDPSRAQTHESPILELISDVSRAETFADGDRIILVSDLIQNSHDMGQFCWVKGALPSFEKFREKSDFWKVEPEALDGVRVEIVMPLLNYDALPHCTEKELKSFFEDYFNYFGAESVKTTRIRLGAG